MRNALIVIAFLCAVLGCNLSSFENKSAANAANDPKPATPTPSANLSPAGAIPTATPKQSILVTLKKSAGKYPNDIKLLENAEMKSRLGKLLGKDFADMKANWNVETPLEIVEGIFKASGCEQHNCGSNSYVMFVDLEKDNINVYHVSEDGNKSYFEKGKIKLPGKFADEVETETQDDDK